MAGLEELCRSNGLVLLTASTSEDPELEDRAVRTLWARGADGLIVAPCRKPTYGRLFGKNAKMPVVVVDRAYPGARYPAVTTDNIAASVALTRAVLATGAPSTAFLCGQPDLPSIADRIRGASPPYARKRASPRRKAISCAHLKTQPAPAGRCMEQLLAKGPPPASFVTSSLMVLEGATQCLNEHMGHIPPRDGSWARLNDQDSLDFLPNRVFSARAGRERGLASHGVCTAQGLAVGAEANTGTHDGPLRVDPAAAARACRPIARPCQELSTDAGLAQPAPRRMTKPRPPGSERRAINLHGAVGAEAVRLS